MMMIVMMMMMLVCVCVRVCVCVSVCVRVRVCVFFVVPVGMAGFFSFGFATPRPDVRMKKLQSTIKHGGFAKDSRLAG